MEGLFTTHDAALILQVHPYTVAKWIDAGKLKSWKTAGGHRRVQAADLKAYLVANKRPIPAELQDADGRLSLLIVDDDPGVLRALVRSLKLLEREISCTTTSSGIEALLQLGSLKPQAMLIDLNMPDLDGYEVIRRVRAFDALKSVTLVAMTANHSPSVVAATQKAGAVGCLAKPFDPGDLLKIIHNSRPSKNKAARAAGVRAAATP